MNNCEAKPRIKDMAKGVIKQHELYDNLVEMTEETWQEYVTIAKIFMSTEEILKSMSDISTQGDAIDMAIEALSSSDALLKQEIDFHKEVSRIEAEKVVDLEHKLADMVSVVRCKDCRHRDLFSCPLADNNFQKDEDFCSWGERREE